MSTEFTGNSCNSASPYKSFHLTQIINKSTRVWEGGESTIDLILVSDEKYISQKGVIEYGISDHNIIFCTRKRSKIRFSNHKTVRIRSLKTYNIDVFKDDLKRVNWNDIQNISIVDDAWKLFKVLFLKVVDKMALLRQVRVKQRTSPWMDQKILEILKNRNRALSIYRRTKNQEDYRKFKALRNLGQKNIKGAKRNFIKVQILENKEDPKSLWKVLNRFQSIGKSKCSVSKVGLDIDSKIEFDKNKVANQFNSFFSLIANSLVDMLPLSNGCYGIDFVKRLYSKQGVLPNCFSFAKVSVNQITKMLEELQVSKSTGLDAIQLDS